MSCVITSSSFSCAILTNSCAVQDTLKIVKDAGEHTADQTKAVFTDAIAELSSIIPKVVVHKPHTPHARISLSTGLQLFSVPLGIIVTCSQDAVTNVNVAARRKLSCCCFLARKLLTCRSQCCVAGKSTGL